MLCIDANVVVPLVLNTAPPSIRSLWAQWRAEREELVAPLLLRYEVVNALHRVARASGHSLDATREAVQTALNIGITLHADAPDHVRALEFAVRLNRPASYDAHYLALAERLGVEFWTADERLYNAAWHALPWVRFVS